MRAWKPEGGAEKWFCGECGSALFSRDSEGGVGVRLGAFDEDPGDPARAHQFVAYAAAWEPIPDDGLPRYPERRRRRLIALGRRAARRRASSGPRCSARTHSQPTERSSTPIAAATFSHMP